MLTNPTRDALEASVAIVNTLRTTLTPEDTPLVRQLLTAIRAFRGLGAELDADGVNYRLPEQLIPPIGSAP